MRKLSLLLVLLAVVGAVWLVRGRSSDERVLRRLMDEVQTAALIALNGSDSNGLDVYFATEAEGAQAAGLGEVKQAFKTFVSQLPNDSAVQFHSFDLDEVEVHQSDGLARVSYRLHFSVIRGNTAIYSAKATQNLALLRTPRGWRISGGDVAQLEEVSGSWHHNKEMQPCKEKSMTSGTLTGLILACVDMTAPDLTTGVATQPIIRARQV